MNSKDRRKHNRKFPYTFEVKRKFDPSTRLYNPLSEIDQWCDNQFGKGNWDKNARHWYSLYKSYILYMRDYKLRTR